MTDEEKLEKRREASRQWKIKFRERKKALGLSRVSYYLTDEEFQACKKLIASMREASSRA